VRIYDGSNWEDYKVELRRFLKICKSVVPLWDLLTGGVERPNDEQPPVVDEGEDEAELLERHKAAVKNWDEADALALQYISSTVAESKRATIRMCEHAADAYAQLEAGATSQSGRSVISGLLKLVRRQLMDYSCMADYLAAIENQNALLRNQKVALPDVLLSALMINGLTEEYATERALLEDKDRDILTVDFVKRRLMEAESNHQASASIHQAFKASVNISKSSPFKVNKYRDGKPTQKAHFERFQPRALASAQALPHAPPGRPPFKKRKRSSVQYICAT
jgi:hypothetical protein